MTVLPNLDVISAGAGSGKTFRIKKTLGQWVKEGLVRPDRIVAVTFTEAAAAELKERVRKELIDLDRTEDALKLDQAYISTIHSFGLRVLSEFAFDGGFPPTSRLLDQNEETALLRHAIARAGDIDTLARELRRYGYTYDGGTQRSGEDQFLGMIRTMIGHLRTVDPSTSPKTLSGFAAEELKRGYGTTGDGNSALDALHRNATALLDLFPLDISPDFDGNASAVSEFRRNHSDLTTARNKDRLATDWPLWQSLRGLRMSKRGAATPDGYDALAEAVIEAADGLPRHPGPLEDAINHAKILISSATEAIDSYASDKRKASLVDYTDMVAAAHMILASESGALKALAERVDCLVIDEFQDTNPLQFSLLWLLRQAGVPTLIVGDLKQAIMGFQGADPRLMERLLGREDASIDTLSRNWRSQPPLMPFVNAIGGGLFGDAYTALAAQSDDGYQPPLEVLEQPKPPAGRANKGTWELRIAERIGALLEDPGQFVRDAKSKQKRRLKAGDIAVLCLTNGQLQGYADALRKFGVRAKIAERGWLASRTVQIACHALEFAENPSDRHAALYLAATEFGEHDLQSALKELIEDGQIADWTLEALNTIQSDENENATIDVVLSRVIGVLDLYGRVSVWPDPGKHRADLLRLEAEAKAFVDAKPETLASGGFYGSGVKTFLAWLAAKVDQDREGDHRPDPDASDSDAVEMVTWHRSKGREWPVVFVCGWDSDVKSRLPDVSVGYETFDNLDSVLSDARISFVPGFAAKEVNDKFLTNMVDETIVSAKRLIYVALTRAKERLVLEWHSHLSNSKRTTYHSVLQDDAGVNLGGDGVVVAGQEFPCLLTGNDGTPPDELTGERSFDPLPTFGRRALDVEPIPAFEGAIFTMPSSLNEQVTTGEIAPQEVSYGTPLALDIEKTGAEFGTLIHRCFEVLTASPRSKSRLGDATGATLTAEQSEAIAASHDALMIWLRETLRASEISAEVPFSATAPDGSVCTGLIDLLVQTPEGFWVIDHKTDRATGGDEIFGHYWPQLTAYRQALQGLGHIVAGVGLNLVNEGKLLLARSADGS